MVNELLSGRTAVHILVAEINKVLLAEATLSLNARCAGFASADLVYLTHDSGADCP
jgi:hypothetical protein